MPCAKKKSSKGPFMQRTKPVVVRDKELDEFREAEIVHNFMCANPVQMMHGCLDHLFKILEHEGELPVEASLEHLSNVYHNLGHLIDVAYEEESTKSKLAPKEAAGGSKSAEATKIRV